jgi:hypothetical protein
MAIRHLNYLCIPQEQRRATAAKALGSLRERLADPTLTEGQRALVLDRVNHLGQWVSGTLKVEDAKVTNHEVEISEEVVIEEG